MGGIVTLRVIGAFSGELFRVIARKPPQTGTPPLRPGAPGQVTAQAVQEGAIATAKISLDGQSAWEIWLARLTGNRVFKLGSIPPSRSNRNTIIDLRDAVAVSVFAKYFAFNQAWLSHTEIAPMMFNVAVRKTEAVPAALLRFFTSTTWHHGFDPTPKKMNGQATTIAPGTYSPYVFHLLKGEDCNITVTSLSDYAVQRQKTVILADALTDSTVVAELKEKTSRVIFAFQDQQGRPAQAYNIWPKHVQPPQMDQTYQSHFDAQGRSVFEGEFRSADSFRLSATHWSLPPCSSVSDVPFPSLASGQATKLIVFPPVPEIVTITVECRVQHIDYISTPPSVLVWMRQANAEGQAIDTGIYDQFGVTCDQRDEQNDAWLGSKDVQVPGGWWWVIYAKHWETVEEASPRDPYIGPTNSNEVYSAVIFSAGPG